MEFIDFDAPVTDKELAWIKKIYGDTIWSSKCNHCGCVVEHRGAQCDCKCEYCYEYHPSRLCIRKKLMCEVCGVPYLSWHVAGLPTRHQSVCRSILNYRKQCLDVMSESELLVSLPPDIQKLLGKYILFGLPNEFEKCCGHTFRTNTCSHCAIAELMCQSKYHCGCDRDGHIFQNEHVCRQCNTPGHWTGKCTVTPVTGIDSIYQLKNKLS